MRQGTRLATLLAGAVFGLPGYGSQPAPQALRTDSAACYDRTVQPQTAVVDSHVHFRPFGGSALPFEDVVHYLEKTGVRFVNVYGIGQTLPVASSCTYYLDCPGVPVKPTLKNDFVNAVNYVTKGSGAVHMTLSMTFPDLARPQSVLDGMRLLDEEFPGLFKWMGEVNLVKQALFDNARRAVPLATIAEWAPFMAVLRERGMPLAIHADLGNDDAPTQYLPWIEAVLHRYPNNPIVWTHMGLSRELVAIEAGAHIAVLVALLDRYPNLTLDISWRVIDDHFFSDPRIRAQYVPLLNTYSDRILPGTDFVASGNMRFEAYREALEATSRINRHLNDVAFRNIALGENYFRLLNLDYEAPEVCPSQSRR